MNKRVSLDNHGTVHSFTEMSVTAVISLQAIELAFRVVSFQARKQVPVLGAG